MSEDKWNGMFETDDLPELFKNVEQARVLGQEGFCAVLRDMANEAVDSEELGALLTGLAIGNIAFGAAPECSIALTDTHWLRIQIVEEA